MFDTTPEPEPEKSPKTGKSSKALTDNIDTHVAKAANTEGLMFVTVRYTPSLAAAILEKRNPNNRSASKSKIAELAEYMADGDFREDTPQVIAFDWSGNLVDGQNRLHAICASGVTLTLYTAFNCAPDVMSYLDAGKNRTPPEEVNRQLGVNYGGDVVRFHKIVQAVRAARKGKKPLNFDAKNSALSRGKQIEVGIAHHAEYAALMKEAPYPRLKLAGIPKSLFYALYALFRAKDKEAARAFMAALAQDPGTVRPAQVVTLIERGAVLVRANVRAFPLQTEMVYNAFAAWNSFRSNQNRAPRYLAADKLRTTPLPDLK